MSWMIVRTFGAAVIVALAATIASGELATLMERKVGRASDYAASMAAADRNSAMMVVYFWDEQDPQCRHFDEEVLTSPVARAHLAGKYCVRLALDTQITSGGKEIRLIDHPAFARLGGGPGLVVLDFSSEVQSERGEVVSSLPFRAERPVEADDLAFLRRPEAPIPWLTDYAEAMARARDEQRMLLIYFERPDRKGGCAEFEANTLSSNRVRERLAAFVCLRLAEDAKVNLKGNATVLLYLTRPSMRHPQNAGS